MITRTDAPTSVPLVESVETDRVAMGLTAGAEKLAQHALRPHIRDSPSADPCPPMPRQHIASPSDCLDSIAYTYGLLPETVWGHPGNAELRALRPQPNLLMPGDVVTIPDKRLRELSQATEQRHRFVRKAVPARITLRVLRLGEPVRNTPWRLVIDDRDRHEGQTDGDGMVRIPLRPNALLAELTVDTTPEPLVYVLSLGAMTPIEEIIGVQQRLVNLGYSIADEELGAMLEGTRSALQRFQHERGLPVTGEPDDTTRAALADATRAA